LSLKLSDTRVGISARQLVTQKRAPEGENLY